MRLLKRRTYYEVLGLQSTCTDKEIRNAFVVLSKELHPDLNMSESKAKSSSQEFIQVMEAYQVLSKAHSRANYDLSLGGIDRMNYVQRDTMHEPWKADPMSAYKRSDSPYYGVKGIKKMANWKIVTACVVFCAFGVMLQVIAITKSITFKREMLDRSSAVHQENHERVRSNAEKLGNALQLERMKQTLQKSGLDVDNDDV